MRDIDWKKVWAAIGLSTMWFAPIAVQANQNVIVVLDDSGSMRQQMRSDRNRTLRIQAAKNALSKVIKGLPSDAQLGILLLNNSGRGNPWLIPLGPISVSSTIPRITQIQAEGGTPLGSQMKVAADALLQLRQKQIYGDYRLLIITDGEANDADLLAAYLPDILSRGISLDVIGVDMAENHSLANRAHSYRRADDVQSFEKALQEVFAESAGSIDDQGMTGFELIADLPDELATGALAALASPRNEDIAYSQARPPPSLFPNASSPSTATSPSSAREGLIGFLSALPCCFTIVIVFILVVALSQKKKR